MIHNGEGVGAMADDAATMRMLIGKQIRQARLSRRWSQSQLARALTDASGGCITTAHYVSRWERGERNPGYVWAPVLEQVLNLDLSTPDEGEPALDDASSVGLEAVELIQPPVATFVDGGSEDDSMRRRTVLGGGLGLAGSAAFSGASGLLEPIRRQLDAALAGPVTEDDAVEWERAVDHHSQLVGRYSTEQVLPGIVADLVDLRSHTQRASATLLPRLRGIGALLSGLSAISLAGAGHWADAERNWRTAQRIARSSGDRRVQCLVNSDRAVFSIYMPGCSPRTVLDLADEALGWANGATTKGVAGALSARAQILSVIGDRAGAYAALNELETVFERLDGEWPEPRVHHVRSFVYSHVGSCRDSAAAQEQALSSYPRPTSPGAVQIQMHRARSIITSGDPLQGVRHIVTVLEQAGPSFCRGYVGTSAEFALAALPQQAKRLPEVCHVRELTSQGELRS